MLYFLWLCQQAQPFHLIPVFRSGGHNVNTSRVDAAVAENIRQFSDVFIQRIKCPGKEFPQIVGKHLVRIYVCLHTKPFHGSPDVAAVQWSTGSGAEEDSFRDPSIVRILEQELLQTAWN